MLERHSEIMWSPCFFSRVQFWRINNLKGAVHCSVTRGRSRPKAKKLTYYILTWTCFAVAAHGKSSPWYIFIRCTFLFLLLSYCNVLFVQTIDGIDSLNKFDIHDLKLFDLPVEWLGKKINKRWPKCRRWIATHKLWCKPEKQSCKVVGYISILVPLHLLRWRLPPSQTRHRKIASVQS